MSTIFKSFRNALSNVGWVANPFNFIFYCIMWVSGAVIGVLLMIIGLKPSDLLRDNDDDEYERMIARLNEEGPNN